MYTYIYMYVCVCTYMCVRIYIFIYRHTHIYIYVLYIYLKGEEVERDGVGEYVQNTLYEYTKFSRNYMHSTPSQC